MFPISPFFGPQKRPPKRLAPKAAGGRQVGKLSWKNAVSKLKLGCPLDHSSHFSCAFLTICLAISQNYCAMFIQQATSDTSVNKQFICITPGTILQCSVGGKAIKCAPSLLSLRQQECSVAEDSSMVFRVQIIFTLLPRMLECLYDSAYSPTCHC